MSDCSIVKSSCSNTRLAYRNLPAEAAEGDVDFLEVENSVVGRFVELDPGWKRFETLDFQFDVPDGFTFVPAPPVTTPVGKPMQCQTMVIYVVSL